MSTYRLGPDTQVDFTKGIVRRGEDVAHLTDIEERMLAYLLDHAGRDIGRGELLERVWGYSPTVRSRAVDQTVKRLRPKIESDPANPTFLQSVYGVGYRLVLPLDPAGSDDQPPSRVPPAPWPIVGRERELEQVLDALAEARVVNLTGEPGSGKSLLAWECARRASAERRYPGGVWVIPCSGVNSLSALTEQIADLLGTERSADLERLEQQLGLHGEILIVLDDCDRLHEDDSLAMLGHHSPSARWLITSRIQIANAQRLALGPLSSEASRTLFLQRAAPAVSPSDPDLDDLLRRLEGSPLAIVLAASYTSLMTPRQLRARFEPRDAVLQLEGSAGDGRSTSIHQVLGTSLALLSPSARDALARLSVFRQRFEHSAAEHVIGPAGLNAVRELHEHSLIRAEFLEDAVLLSMSALVQALAGQQLTDATDAEDARDDYLAGLYLELQRMPAQVSWDQDTRLLPYVQDLEHAVQRGEHRPSWWGVALGLHSVHGMRADVFGKRRIARRLARAPGQPESPALQLHLCLVRVASLPPAEQLKALDGFPAAQLARCTIGDRMCLARARGHLLLSLGDREGAIQSGRSAVEAAADHGAPLWDAVAAIHLGRMVGMSGELEGASEAFEQAIALASDRDTSVAAFAHYCRGYASLQALELDTAHQHFAASRHLAHEAGDPRSVMLTALLGLVGLARGHYESSETLFLDSARYGSRVAMRSLEDEVLVGCSIVLQGEFERAETIFEDALQRRRRLGLKPGTAALALAATRRSLRRDATPRDAKLRAASSDFQSVATAARIALGEASSDALTTLAPFDQVIARRLLSAWRRPSR